jgi:outer membrane protein assembly factor BamB
LAITGCRNHDEGPAATSAVGQIPAETFIREWVADLDLPAGQEISELHVRDEIVFAYTPGHRVFFINKASGQLMASVTVPVKGPRLFPPILLPDRVVFPTTTSVEIYNLKGRHLRSLETRVALRSGGVGKDNMIYGGSDHSTGGRLVAVDLDRNYVPVVWEVMTFGGISSTPALHQGVIFVGSEDGDVYAVNDERRPVWGTEDGVFRTDGKIVSDLRVDDYGLYVNSTDSKLYCVHRTTGKVRWQYFGGTPLRTAPEVTQDLVYQYVPRTGLVALNRTDDGSDSPPPEFAYNRTPRWIVPDARQFLAEGKDFSYLRRKDDHVMAVDKKTGAVRFVSKQAFSGFGVNTKNDIVFVATKDGRVVAVKPVLKAGSAGELVMVFEETDQT